MSLRKSTERAGKQVVRGALRVLFRRPLRPEPISDPGEVRRICVIRGDNRLGNLLLLTPLLTALRDAFPAARLDVLISADAYPDVYAHQSFLDEVITAPKKAMARNPLKTIPFARLLRSRDYDLVFDASHMHEFSLTTAWAARLTRARWRIAYRRGDADLFCNWLVESPGDQTHECGVHVHLLESVMNGADAVELRPRYQVSEAERAEAAETWKSLGLGDDVIGLFVGARGKKRWPVERFVRVAGELIDDGHACALFGGPAEAEALARIDTRGIVVPPADVRRFAALLERCRLVVSADTGPMHLAVAVGVPTVELFLASDPARYGYAHLSGHRVLTDSVDVSDVVAAVHELLGRRGEPSALGESA